MAPDNVIRREAVLAPAMGSSALLEAALAEAAGEGAEPVSLTLDYGAPLVAGQPVLVEAWVDRATRTLVFAHARLLSSDARPLLTASAVLRRAAAAAA